jgi:CRP/FNR family cyclic AMP-dependent transcriptional regulator
MSLHALVAPLRRVPLFSGLAPLQITEIARRAERIVFQPGETIVREGRAGAAAFLLVSGDAVRVGGPGLGEEAELIEPGSLIGEMAMLIEHTYGSSIMARGHVRALRISRAEMLAQMEEDPELAELLVAHIAGRLARVAEELRGFDRALAHSMSAGLPAE